MTALWVLDVPDGDERCVADPPVPRSPRASTTCRPRSGCGASGRARRAAGITAYATDAAHAVAAGAPGRPARRGRPRPRARAGSSPCPGRSSTRARTRPAAGWRGSTGGRSGSPSSTTPTGARARRRRRPRGPLGRGRVHRRRGDGPLPRVLVVPRRHRAARGARSTTPRCPAGGSPTRPDPELAPTEVAYPAAGHRQRRRHRVGARARRARASRSAWDRDAWPYLAAASVGRPRPAARAAAAGPARHRGPRRRPGHRTRRRRCSTDADAAWVERAPGTPARLGDGRLVMCSDRTGARQLLVDGEAGHPRRPAGASGRRTSAPTSSCSPPTRWTTPPARSCGGGPPAGSSRSPRATASTPRSPAATRSSCARWGWTRTAPRSRCSPHRRSTGAAVGRAGHRADGAHPRLDRRHPPRAAAGGASTTSGARRHRHRHPPARGPRAAARRCPVLLDPYGGPHAQRVLQARGAFTSSQWFADQGFAVVVVDGRGTPGRGAAWERAVHRDLATPVLEDQVDALARRRRARAGPRPRAAWRSGAGASAATWPPSPSCAAPTWSTPRSPARRSPTGASTTPSTPSGTWATRRPSRTRTRPARCWPTPPRCAGRCCSIHGLADDNVVAAHTLQLSARLLAAGRPHQVLPLTGVTHMASQEDVAENLLLLQLAFLREALHLG